MQCTGAWAHAFAPADAETAEPECSACGGSDPETCPFCARRAEEETEPEAPECKHTWSDWQRVPSPYDSHWENRRCSRCGAWDNDNIRVAHNGTRGNATPPRRPPYAVAYALASGELYEVALSGDAVATVEHGVLKISHPQGVAHIIQVKPMEGA